MTETQAKELISVIQSSNQNLPLAESGMVITPTPLHFDPSAILNSNQNDVENKKCLQPVVVHIDSKREVPFLMIFC
jgi:hypothetical protein